MAYRQNGGGIDQRLGGRTHTPSSIHFTRRFRGPSLVAGRRRRRRHDQIRPSVRPSSPQKGERGGSAFLLTRSFLLYTWMSISTVSSSSSSSPSPSPFRMQMYTNAPQPISKQKGKHPPPHPNTKHFLPFHFVWLHNDTNRLNPMSNNLFFPQGVSWCDWNQSFFERIVDLVVESMYSSPWTACSTCNSVTCIFYFRVAGMNQNPQRKKNWEKSLTFSPCPGHLLAGRPHLSNRI
jgi:hypothetical protein